MRVNVKRTGFRNGRKPVCKSNQPFNTAVEVFFVKRTVGNGVADLLYTDSRVARHFEIFAGAQPRAAVESAAPVAHNNSVKAPLAAQNISYKTLVFGRKNAVYAIVGSHDGVRFALADSQFKRAQIKFPDSAFVNNAVAVKTGVFLIVQRKMLHAGGHAVFSHAEAERSAHFARKQRVFAVILKISAAKRVALYVDAGTEQRMNAVAAALLAYRGAHSVRVFGLPRTGNRRGGRERRRGFGRRNAVIAAAYLLAQSVRTVRHGNGRYAEPLHRTGIHKIRALNEPRLFGKRQIFKSFVFFHKNPQNK